MYAMFPMVAVQRDLGESVPARLTSSMGCRMVARYLSMKRGQPGGVPLAKANPAEQGDAGGVQNLGTGGWIVGVAEAHYSRTLPA
jgi:hypothetical protein